MKQNSISEYLYTLFYNHFQITINQLTNNQLTNNNYFFVPSFFGNYKNHHLNLHNK